MSRPANLPDYQSPPLNEVVLGVQFEPPEGYQQIRVGEVWALYRDHYPIVQEQQALRPVFEAFGLPPGAQFDFGIVAGATHDRFWFVSPKQDELIQFQNDRLLHNWRKVGETNEYPRYETIIKKFDWELRALERYMASLHPSPDPGLKINQSEITYINHIPCEGDAGTPIPAGKWLSLFNIDAHQFEDFNCTFRRRVLRPDGSPYARLTCQASVGFPRKGRVIVLTLTFRGAPQKATIDGALEFLGTGRQMIVEFFTQITTKEAHAIWGRNQ
jgi:uncharacterized protein (TIGR04255 family)